MDIREYLHQNRMNCKELAQLADIHPTYLRAIKAGKYKPSRKLSEKLELLTGGQVKAKELRDGISRN